VQFLEQCLGETTAHGSWQVQLKIAQKDKNGLSKSWAGLEKAWLLW